MECIRITVCMALLVCVLVSQCIQWAVPTTARFLFRNHFMETCFCSFLIKFPVSALFKEYGTNIMKPFTLWFLSASNTVIPCMWTFLDRSFIPHPYISLIYRRNFLFMLVFNLFQFVRRWHLDTLMCHPCTCALTNSVQQPLYTLPSQSSLQKRAGGKSQLCSNQSSNRPSSEYFLTIDSYFECYTYCVKALGWLMKEKKRKKERWTILTFDRFKVCHFKIVTTSCYYYCRLGHVL